MSFDYRKLRGRIIECYGTQMAFSKEIGLSNHSLSMKMNGKLKFSQDEIERISKTLSIEPSEIGTYFFTRQVQNLEHCEATA